jgi:hypothetical protein
MMKKAAPKMTVAELIEKLQQFPPETRVVVAGYEDGFNDVAWVDGLDIALNVHTEDYYGAHENSEDVKGEFEIVPAVALRGYNQNSKEKGKYSI